MMAFGSHAGFPLAGGSKRQGCVSHSTPEAEIIAADYALRTHAIPIISLWKTLVQQDPKIVFHDDNQGMIAIIRSGQNPTMRHLERTHGISIQWMHEIFQNDLIYLVYEITSKMCADIHTKAFKDHMTWKRACMLINILSYEDISSEDVWSTMQPTHDTSTQLEQHYKQRNTQVPTFPYTETPILPLDVYTHGLSSKEGLQLHPDCDPIVVVKAPRLYRTSPPGLPSQHPWLRSTWVLRNGQWVRVEDHVDPQLDEHRFDNWAERADFQFHPVDVPATPAKPIHPRLVVSIADLFHPKTIETPRFINALTEHQILVTNALLRIVHGGWDVDEQETNKMLGLKETAKEDKDYWIEEENVLIRVHKKERTKFFDPREKPHPKIPLHMLEDERRTMRVEPNSNEESDGGWRLDEDGWNYHIDNWRTGGCKIHNDEPWIGRTVFKRRKRERYLSAPSVCSETINLIPKDDLFIVGHVSCVGKTGGGSGRSI